MTGIPRPPALWAGPRLYPYLAMLVLAVCGGCAFSPTAGQGPALSAAESPTRSCLTWYATLDEVTGRAGVRDAGAAAVPGHPYLRVDRFHASLRDRLATDAGAAVAAAGRAALLERLLALDLQARRHELRNLPEGARATLAGIASRPPEPDALLDHTRACGETLVQAALHHPVATDTMLQALSVPHDYVDAYRALGLYPLTRIPFLHGVRRFEARTRAAFNQPLAPEADARRLRLAPPWRPSPAQVTPDALRTLLRPAPDDPLGIPAPTRAQQDILFAHFAPTLDLGVASDDDLPGALVWPDGLPAQGPATPAPDIRTPVVYRQLAYTRHGTDTLLQLVYTVWFAARTPTAQPIDLLAGRLDGLMWRVTLSPGGVPLVYDSIHPCGCYHQFFAPPWVQPRPAPDPHAEWAFSPAPAPALQPGRHLVLRVAPATHYLQAVEVQPAGSDPRYAWRDYDALRSLPSATGAHRSIFDSDGFIAGTERAESWLFWPMGIARAGSMRQWGRHATAFVGRRHFDDARLIEQRFVLEAPPQSGE